MLPVLTMKEKLTAEDVTWDPLSVRLRKKLKSVRGLFS